MFSTSIHNFYPRLFNSGTMLPALAKASKTNCSMIFDSKLKMVDLCCRAETRRTFILGKVLSSRKIRPQMIKRYDDETDWYGGRNDQEDQVEKVITLDPDEVQVDEKFQDELRIKENTLLKQSNKKSAKHFGNIKHRSFEKNSSCNLNFSKRETKKMDGKPDENKKRFIRLQQTNNLLSETLMKLKSKKGRRSEEKIVLEGKRLIHDAISAGYKPLGIFYSRLEDVHSLNVPENVPLHRASYKILQLWSDVVTTQGLVGVFNMPKMEKVPDSKSIPITVICDNIREPGNLGAVIRVVAGVGCEKIILTKGCVDIWEQKVLRSASGGHFRLPIVNELNWDEIEKEVSKPSHVVLADKEILKYDENHGKDEKNDVDNTFCSSDSFKTIRPNDLPLYHYDSLNYNYPTVIVIGGETHGLSEAAYQFAKQRNGVRVCIPMCNKIESLNTAVALGIISYEIRRQLNVLSKLHEENDDSKISEASCISEQ